MMSLDGTYYRYPQLELKLNKIILYNCTVYTLKASANKIKFLVSLIWIPNHLTYFWWTFAIESEVCHMMGCQEWFRHSVICLTKCTFLVRHIRHIRYSNITSSYIGLSAWHVSEINFTCIWINNGTHENLPPSGR